MRSLFLAAAVALAIVTPAAAQNRPLDPRDYQSRHAGEPTQILVIGSPHLSGAPPTFDPAVLEPLLERLAAFQPDAIAIEAMPGRTIAMLWDYRASYPEVATTYASRAMTLSALARPGVNMDMAEADAAIRQAMRERTDNPSPAQRRRMAALFAAAGDIASAIAQWWQLDASERVPDESVPAALAEQFNTYETPVRRNENYLIAARLAGRLGLARIYPMDDQSAEVGPEYPGNFEADMNAFTNEPWFEALMNSPGFTPLREAPNHLTSPEEALATYRMLNSSAAGRADADGQWLSLINRESPNAAGRARVAAWEARNLRMAANIREVAAQFPGGRVLVLTGSAHKAWLDAYLRMMSDVEVVDASRVLR